MLEAFFPAPLTSRACTSCENLYLSHAEREREREQKKRSRNSYSTCSRTQSIRSGLRAATGGFVAGQQKSVPDACTPVLCNVRAPNSNTAHILGNKRAAERRELVCQESVDTSEYGMVFRVAPCSVRVLHALRPLGYTVRSNSDSARCTRGPLYL